MTRIEAWSNGERVGLTTREHFVSRGTHSDYYLTIPQLPPGSHSLLLKAFLQNGVLAATATMPITILPDPPTSANPQGYRGNIDLPTENELLGLFPLPSRVGRSSTTARAPASVPSKSGTAPGKTVSSLPRLSTAFIAPTSRNALGDQRFASSGFLAQLSPSRPHRPSIYVRIRESGETYASPRFRQSPCAQ